MLKEESLSYICLGGIDVDFRKLMSRAGLTKSEGKQVAALINLEEGYETPLSYRRLQELKGLLAGCEAFLDKMMEKSRRAYPLVTGYLEQEGLLDPVSWVLVDSGWTGSMQKSLQHLLESMGYEGKMEGYYFGMYEYPESVDRDAYHYWYFGPGNGLRRKAYFSNSLFECIFSSPEGMTAAYEEAGKVYCPVLEKPWNPNREKIEKTTGYLRAYAEKLSENAGKEYIFENKQDNKRRKLAFSLLKSFMGRPDAEEAENFGSYVFCDDVIGESDQRVAAGLTPEQIYENRFLRKVVGTMKKNGGRPRESAWLEGSIVRVGMKVSELRHCAVCKYVLYFRKLMRNYVKRIHG